MRSLALVTVFVGFAIGCGSSLVSPDGGGGGKGGGGGAGGSGGCMAGASLPSPDGCNSCTCTAGGELVCTDRACPPPPCVLDTTYRFGYTGGLVAYEDASTLTPPNAYTHTRSPRFTDPPDITCSPALPACNSVNLIDAADIILDIASSDVAVALASATPPIYGRDPRAYDGSIFQFLRADGRGFLAGADCGTGVSGCVDVPPGVAKLVADLIALDAQQLMDASCAALR